MNATSPLIEVVRAQQQVDQAKAELRHRVRDAVLAGRPIAQVARAAGVTRPTVYAWVGGGGA